MVCDLSPRDLQRDDDLASSVPFAQVPEGVGDLAQLVPPVDDRRNLPGFEELGQHHEVRLGQLRDEEETAFRRATAAPILTLITWASGPSRRFVFGPPIRTRGACGSSTRLHARHDLLPATSIIRS